MSAHDLLETARAIVADHKGILAADESTATIKKRFDSIGVENTEENRRAYRNLLFTTPASSESDRRRDPLRRDDPPERRRRDAVRRAARGQRASSPGSRSTPARSRWRCTPARWSRSVSTGYPSDARSTSSLGARFAKWRAVITIGDGMPTRGCIRANAHALARYAAICQEAGLVPIVEPEVLMDADNTIEVCYDATARTLEALYEELWEQGVDLEGTLLKPNMVISGKGCPEQAPAARGRRADRRSLPARRPRGRARHRLSLRRAVGARGDREPERDQPGLRQPLAALVLLRSRAAGLRAPGVGRERGNVEAAQAAFLHRARMNSLAAAGEWSAELERAVAV